MRNDRSAAWASRGLWLAAGAAALLVGTMFQAAGLRIAPANLLPLALLTGAVLLVSARRASLRARSSIAVLELVELWCLFLLASMLGGLASYAGAALSTGYADDTLAAVDRTLGFDWVELYRFVAERPGPSVVGRTAYAAIFFLPPLILIGLVMTGRADRARGFVGAFGIALAITNAIFPLFPARSALLRHLGSGEAYMPATGVHHADMIEALRNGSVAEVDPARLLGLITFPSFHVAAGVLFIWAAAPLARLGPVVAAMSLLMIAATPVEGTHYLVDVIGGALVGAAAVVLFQQLGERRFPPLAPRARRPAPA